MTLTLHNTLTRRAEVFVPGDRKRVTMYVCGPTVYGPIHIGNARAVVVFDLLFRLLRAEFGAQAVIYARNITDIDDKIIQAAAAADEEPATLAARFAAEFNRDAAALGAIAPSVAPCASAHIGQMCAMIQTLLDRECAYRAAGHILFRINAAPFYGALSNRSRDEMIAGARVEPAPFKKDPADFVLWKPAAADEPGYPSPWGRGRPGWHLECSAMAGAHLGEVIDIHGGGQDLIFPHHENEIAQTRCATGGDYFARFWVHNGHLTRGGEKMSKSLGNIITLRETLAAHPGEAVRYALLSGHYRQPLDFSPRLLTAAKTALDRLYRALAADNGDESARIADPAAVADSAGVAGAVAESKVVGEVRDALAQDMNTPIALKFLHECATRINKEKDKTARRRLQAGLQAAGALIGFFTVSPQKWLRGEWPGRKWQSPAAAAASAIASTAGSAADESAADESIAAGIVSPSEEEIAAAIRDRKAARATRDFARADAIRADLQARGIILQDDPTGTRWRRI